MSFGFFFVEDGGACEVQAHVAGKIHCVLRSSEELELATPPTTTEIDLHIGAIKP